MKRILSGIFSRQKYLAHSPKRYIHEINFEGDEEILDNYLGKIKLIGINMPNNKNILSENALDKLYNSVKDFYLKDELYAAILHSCGGNFCCGVVQTERALERCQELIEVLDKGHKPVLASLKGITSDFGFQLATMCDLKVIEEGSYTGLGYKRGKAKLSDTVYNRLVSIVGITHAGLVVLTNASWCAADAKQNGFANDVAQHGCGLGIALNWAQSIVLSPLNEIVEKKAKLKSSATKIVGRS